MTKTRVMIDWNSTPVCSPNPKWIDDGKQTDPDINGNYHWIRHSEATLYAANSLGFEKTFMVYDGTLNRAPTWCNPDLTLKPLTYDSQRRLYNIDQAAEGSFYNPPQELQVKMCAALSNIENPFPLDGCKTPRHVPVIFDLENPSVVVDGGSSRPESVRNMTNALRWAKSLKADSAVMAYGWPSHKNTQEAFDSGGWQAFADATDYLCGGVYMWDVPTANPNAWFDEIDMQTKLYDRFYKHIPRIAVLCPLYQIYFPHNDAPWVVAFNNKPIDLGVWKKMLTYLVDRDYHIYVWLGNTPLNDQVKILLQEANKFQL